MKNGVRRLLVTASVVPSSPILVTLMKEALRSSETSVPTRVTRHNIPEDAILHSHRRENLKSYIKRDNYKLISNRNHTILSQPFLKLHNFIWVILKAGNPAKILTLAVTHKHPGTATKIL
jgi:hypothetical protein